jgi:hypothetical protein
VIDEEDMHKALQEDEEADAEEQPVVDFALQHSQKSASKHKQASQAAADLVLS